MKPSEILDTALTEHLPDAEHWVQRCYGTVSRVCIMGAIGRAATGRTIVDFDFVDTPPEVAAALDELAARIVELTGSPRERRKYAEGLIVAYNDAQGRSYDEIRELLEKTRAGLQERGQ